MIAQNVNVLSREQLALKVVKQLICLLRKCIQTSPNFSTNDFNQNKKQILLLLDKLEQENTQLSTAIKENKWKNYFFIQIMNQSLVNLVKYNIMNAKFVSNFLAKEHQKFNIQSQMNALNNQNTAFQESQKVKKHTQDFMKQMHYINSIIIKMILLSSFTKQQQLFTQFKEQDIQFFLERPDLNSIDFSLIQKINAQQTIDLRFANFIHMLKKQFSNLRLLNSQIKATKKLQFFGLFMFKRILAHKDSFEQSQVIKKVWNNFVHGWLVENFEGMLDENKNKNAQIKWQEE